MNIGKGIRLARKANKLNQVDLANLIGVTRLTITYIENSTVMPKKDTVTKLCKALNIDNNMLSILSIDTTDLHNDLKGKKDIINNLKSDVLKISTNKEPSN